MIKAGVRQELDSLSPAPSAAASLAAASGSGGSGARGSSLTYQAPQPTPVPLPPGLNKDREQRQGNVFARLSGVGQVVDQPPVYATSPPLPPLPPPFLHCVNCQRFCGGTSTSNRTQAVSMPD